MRSISTTPRVPGQRDGSVIPTPTAGFQARIKDASLSDLVQLGCLAGSKLVVRVASGDDVGYLYFRGGSVVHALTPGSSGEAAVIEMLGWSGGTFEPGEGEWPAKETISCSGQTLLLHAAQAQDEKEAKSGVALRADASRTPKMDSTPMAESIELVVTPLQVDGHTLRSEDLQYFLRMSRDGTVVESRGSTSELADITAYAVRLSQLVGEQLGLDRFAAMECAFKHGRCFIVLQRDGDVVAFEPHASTDSSSLREMLGL
jgi:Domain of unknown function (DUF4388)